LVPQLVLMLQAVRGYVDLVFSQKATKNKEGDRTIAASGGILFWPEAHLDCIRPGIIMYGSDSSKYRHSQQVHLFYAH